MKRKLLSILLTFCLAFSLLPTAALAEGEGTAVSTGESETPAGEYVAKVGEQGYATLAGAFDAAKESENDVTIVLQKSCEGKGLFLEAGSKNITIDFNGNTYTVTGLVGSTGTENQAAHFEKGNTVKLMNGTLKVADSVKSTAKFLIQNYCNLTGENMIFDGENLLHTSQQPLVPSRFMRKIICRLRLNEVSRQ